MLFEFIAKEGGISLLEVNPGLAIWTFIVFGIVLFILHRFAWGPISLTLDTRAAKIHGDIDRAQKIRDEAEQKLSAYLSQLDGLKAESQKLLEQSRKDAEALRNKILIEAKEEAHSIVEKGKSEIRASKNKAIEDVQKHIIEMAVSLAGRILQRGLKPEDYSTLMQTSLTDLQKKISEA